MEIDNIFLYRMMHIDNIPHVLKHGVTHKNSTNRNPDFHEIGDKSLIDTRSSKQVVVDNGNHFSEEVETIVLGDFIPFYFGLRMPMLYVIKVGGNFVEQRTLSQNIVYVVCSLRSIIDEGVPFYFSDGHATDSFTVFYDASHANRIGEIINWKAIKTKYWGGHENLNVKREKQAEFLAREDISVGCIRGFVAYNENAKEKLIKFGVIEDNIKVVPNAYY